MFLVSSASVWWKSPFQPDLYDFDLSRRAVFQAGVQAVPEGRAVQQATEEAVLQQTRPLLLHHLLQLRLQVSVQLQAAEQRQQPQQAGFSFSQLGGTHVLLAFHPGDGQLDSMRRQLPLQTGD